MYRYILTITIMLLLAGFVVFPRPSLADDGKNSAPATLTISEPQREVLTAAKAWKIEITHNYPRNTKLKGAISIQEDCERLLEQAGWEVDAQKGTVVLRIRVVGTAKSSSYHATPPTRYSGAEVIINAVITTADSPPKTILTFSSVKGTINTPYTIGGGYLTPADAPYDRAYQQCRDFHTQLLSIIYAVKGAKAAYGSNFRDACSAIIQASSDRAFVPLLIDDLLTDNRHRDVATCLGAMGDTRAVEPLCMSLVDKDGDVWEPAASALGKLGDVKAVPPLRTALLSVNSKPSPVASALRDLKWRPETAKEKVTYWLALDEPNKVKQMKAEAIPVLIELLSVEKWAAPAAAQLLGEMKEASAVSPLSRTLLGGKSSAGWKRRSLRLAAAKALSKIGDPKVVEPLAMALMSDDDDDVREACVTGLGKSSSELAVKSIAQAMGSDDDSSVRKMCATELGKAEGELAVKSLIQAVLTDKEASVVIAAEDALGQLRARGSVECLLKSLNHENSGVRTHAAHALKLIGDTRAVPAISDRLEKETDKQVRQAMVDVLAELGAQAGTLSFEAHISLLAKQRDWEELRTFLNEQPTDKVIESLRLDEELVNKVARFILAQRTEKYDLQSYDDWKQWWKLQGDEPSTGGTALKTPESN